MPHMGVRRDPAHAATTSRPHWAAAPGTDLSAQAIANDLSGAERSVQRDAVAGYLDILSRLMLTEDMPAWAPHMRSTTPLRKSPTRFMTDPVLGSCCPRRGPGAAAARSQRHRLPLRGHRRARPPDLRAAHWRPDCPTGETTTSTRWTSSSPSTTDGGAPSRSKMNPSAVDAAAASLLRFRDKVDTSKTGAPAFLAVATTRSAALRRQDGMPCSCRCASLGP